MAEINEFKVVHQTLRIDENIWLEIYQKPFTRINVKFYEIRNLQKWTDICDINNMNECILIKLTTGGKFYLKKSEQKEDISQLKHRQLLLLHKEDLWLGTETIGEYVRIHLYRTSDCICTIQIDLSENEYAIFTAQWSHILPLIEVKDSTYNCEKSSRTPSKGMSDYFTVNPSEIKDTPGMMKGCKIGPIYEPISPAVDSSNVHPLEISNNLTTKSSDVIQNFTKPIDKPVCTGDNSMVANNFPTLQDQHLFQGMNFEEFSD